MDRFWPCMQIAYQPATSTHKKSYKLLHKSCENNIIILALWNSCWLLHCINPFTVLPSSAAEMPVHKTQETVYRLKSKWQNIRIALFGCYGLTPSWYAVAGKRRGRRCRPVRKSVCLNKTWHRTLYKHWHLNNQHIHNNTTTTTKKHLKQRHFGAPPTFLFPWQ